MIKIYFSKIFRGLVLIFLGLLAIHIFFIVLYILTGANHLIIKELMNLFNLNEEKNIPTMFNSFILIISALILWILANNEKDKKGRILWMGMSLIFLFIGLDDFTSIHEGVYKLIPLGSGTGFMKYRWVIPYGILTFVISLIYFKHIFGLPKKIRNLIILSGIIYVTGGIGLEMLSGYFIDQGQQIMVMVAYTLEETGEIVGILIFIHALILYLKMKNKTIAIEL